MGRSNLSKCRKTKRRKTKRRKTNRRKTKNRYTKKKNTSKVNNNSDINKFIRKNLPGYKLIKILNSKQTGGLYDDINTVPIGKGKYAQIFAARDTSTDENIVIKKFNNIRGYPKPIESAQAEFFFGQIVNALTVDNNDLQRKLDANEELNINMVLLFNYLEEWRIPCNNYLALYKGYNDGDYPTHNLNIFYLNTHKYGGVCYHGKPLPSHYGNNGGFKLFGIHENNVDQKSIRLPPRVVGKDYSSVKVPRYKLLHHGDSIVMEYVKGVTLHIYLGEIVNEYRINESLLRPVIKQVLEFIAMINNSYLSHNDLNFDNIIIDHSDSKNVSVTVIDYGLMGVTGYYHIITEFQPTSYKYNGPFAGGDISVYDYRFIYNNTDTYSLFLNLIKYLNTWLYKKMVTTNKLDEKIVINDILNGYINSDLATYFQYWSDEFKDFMKLALTYDNVVKAEPYGSTTAETLLEHDWITGGRSDIEAQEDQVLVLKEELKTVLADIARLKREVHGQDIRD